MFCKVDVQNFRKLRNFRYDLLSLPERIKIKMIETLVANVYHEKEYVIHIINLKQSINHGLVLKKVHKVIVN